MIKLKDLLDKIGSANTVCIQKANFSNLCTIEYGEILTISCKDYWENPMKVLENLKDKGIDAERAPIAYITVKENILFIYVLY